MLRLAWPIRLVASAALLMLLPSRLLFMNLTLMPSWSNRVAASAVRPTIIFRSSMRSPCTQITLRLRGWDATSASQADSSQHSLTFTLPDKWRLFARKISSGETKGRFRGSQGWHPNAPNSQENMIRIHTHKKLRCWWIAALHIEVMYKEQGYAML